MTCELCDERPATHEPTVEKANGGKFTMRTCAECTLRLLDVLP